MSSLIIPQMSPFGTANENETDFSPAPSSRTGGKSPEATIPAYWSISSPSGATGSAGSSVPVGFITSPTAWWSSGSASKRASADLG